MKIEVHGVIFHSFNEITHSDNDIQTNVARGSFNERNFHLTAEISFRGVDFREMKFCNRVCSLREKSFYG